MSAVIRFLRGLFLDNLPLKLLSVGLAVALVLVKFEDKPADITLTIPVRVTTPENKVLTSTLITKVQVTIKGRYGLLRQFSDERPKGLDIALTGDEQEQFTFDPKSIELPPELTVVSITPPVMLVRLDDRVEATLPLKVNIEGAPKPGYRTVETRVEPGQVRVSGAARAVAALEAVQTERVSLVGRSQTARLDVALAEPPQHIQYLTDRERFAVTLVIEEIQETREFADVPIVVVNTHEDGPEYEAAPGRLSVSLFGPVRVLDTISADDLRPHVEVSVKPPGRSTIKERPVIFEPPAELTLVRKDLPKVTLVRREPQPEPPPLPVPLGPVVPGSAPAIPGVMPASALPSTPPSSPESAAAASPSSAAPAFELVGPLRVLVEGASEAEPAPAELEDAEEAYVDDAGAGERPPGVGLAPGRPAPKPKGR